MCKKQIRLQPLARLIMSSSVRSKKLVYPAADRNKEPILSTLKSYLSPAARGDFLEISSGSGQHVSHIAAAFPSLIFHPTEVEESLLGSIDAYAAESSNIQKAQILDVTVPPTQWFGTDLKGKFDFVYNANMMHISPWACSEGLFAGVSHVLKSGGVLFTYGPYAVNGTITPDSNVRFDKSLRSQNSTWGLRDIYLDLVPCAMKHSIVLKDVNDMPANNKLLVWEKT